MLWNSSHLLLLGPDKLHFTDLMFHREDAALVWPEGETAKSVEVVLFIHLEIRFLPSRGPPCALHPSPENQLCYFHKENCAIISEIRGIILLSIRLHKGNLYNHEPLLCKLAFCWHWGSASAAKLPFSLRAGSADGSPTIIALIGLWMIDWRHGVDCCRWRVLDDLDDDDDADAHEDVVFCVCFPANTLKPTKQWSNKWFSNDFPFLLCDNSVKDWDEMLITIMTIISWWRYYYQIWTERCVLMRMVAHSLSNLFIHLRWTN